jgi:three-Cys-motif partner protein
MLTKKTLWPIQPHTVAKHEILKRYLAAWFPIVGSKFRNLIYIDGFCGPGRYSGGEPGSPIVAIEQALKHSDLLQGRYVRFRFVDEKKAYIDHLNAELSQITIPSNFNVVTNAGEFALDIETQFASGDLRSIEPSATFAFIDPFGFSGIPFDLVHRLLSRDRTEIFINIMADSVNRFLSHPEQSIRSHIVDLFGTDEVLNIGHEGSDRIDKLRLLYQDQLKKHARFVRYFEMRDGNNRPIYFLFFATNHPLGQTKMKQAFWNVDPVTGNRFSDATNPNQLVLLVDDDTTELSLILLERFRNLTVLTDEVRVFVEEETIFLNKHMKAVLKQLEDSGQLTVLPLKADGTKRRANTFPDGVMISFIKTR